MPLFITYQNKTLLSAPGAELVTCSCIPEKNTQRETMVLVTEKDKENSGSLFTLLLTESVPVFMYHPKVNLVN